MEDEIKTHERLASIEVEIKSIKENHLTHIYALLEKVDNRSWWILSTLILGFLATILFKVYD
jgi:hypothetical protein